MAAESALAASPLDWRSHQDSPQPWWRDAENRARDRAGSAWNAATGTAEHAANFITDVLSDPAKSWTLASDVGLTALGALTMAGGAGGELGGVVLDASVVGAVLGVPANVASAGIILAGAGTATTGARRTSNDLSTMWSESSEGASVDSNPSTTVYGNEYNWADAGSLDEHFAAHGSEVGARTPAEYAAKASAFLERAQREGLPTKIDGAGRVRVFDPKTGNFGSFRSNGMTVTFFRPSSQTYWARQPGVLQ